MIHNIKKLAVIGGTGKAGKYLVKQLLLQGYRIKLLVRNPEKFCVPHSNVEVITGDGTRFESITALIKDTDAVISTLGLGNPPSEPDIFSIVTRHIIRAMNDHGIKRYVVVTGLNVDAVEDKKGPVTQSATEWMYNNYPRSTADRQLEYTLLRASNLAWTLVRLPLIDQTDEIHEVSVSLEDCPGSKISATSLAVYLIQQIADKTSIQRAPFLANA